VAVIAPLTVKPDDREAAPLTLRLLQEIAPNEPEMVPLTVRLPPTVAEPLTPKDEPTVAAPLMEALAQDRAPELVTLLQDIAPAPIVPFTASVYPGDDVPMPTAEPVHTKLEDAPKDPLLLN
jgi:hypothetical protein